MDLYPELRSVNEVSGSLPAEIFAKTFNNPNLAAIFNNRLQLRNEIDWMLKSMGLNDVIP